MVLWSLIKLLHILQLVWFVGKSILIIFCSLWAGIVHFEVSMNTIIPFKDKIETLNKLTDTNEKHYC